jgi:enamine deaminase RidA (YjgF/YER057c/UK114 family)
MAERTNISSGSPFEPTFGFSRAVKVGQMVFVSGSTAIQSDGTVAGVGDAYTQTVETLRTIAQALQRAGASLQEVVRTRIFVTNINHFEAVQRAHAECFGTIRPASTLVEVSRLVHPDMLIEIEADAVILDKG